MIILGIGSLIKLNAQCQIYGNIIDDGNEPVAYANVILENSTNNARILVFADDKGYFCLKNLVQGSYILTISRIGNETYSTSIQVKPDDETINLNDIITKTISTGLSEVIVTANVHVNEIKPSTIKYKTSSLISETGGTAGDILKNMPSVAMGGSPGHNRDIRFRGLGNAYTKVLINGRESGLSGNNRETILDQLPAGAISHIEIIAVPGAEYQSEGINGLVNIVLKDNSVFGTHGKIDVSTGNNDGLSGGFSLSNKKERLNLYANYDFLQRSIPKPKEKIKTDFKNDAVTQIEDSYEYEDKKFTNHNLRAGFDYFLLPRTKFSGEFLMGSQVEDKEKSLEYIRTDANYKFKSSARELKTEYKPNSFNQFHSSIEHTFADRTRLFANGSYQKENQQKTEIKQTYALTKEGKWADFKPALENKFENVNGGRVLLNAGVTKLNIYGNTIAFGYSGILESRKFLNTTEKFNYADTTWKKSINGFDNFRILENIHAFYITDEYNFRFIRLKSGLRFENTSTKGETGTDSLNISKSNYLLLPSASVTINIDKTQYISVNFGRRVRRPGFKDLNPYTEQKEPLKLVKGNPSLKPETAWAYEIGYLKNFKKFNVGANVFYRSITDVIQKTISEDDNFIITEQPENTGNAYVTGYELMTTVKPFSFWQITSSFSQFESGITSGTYQGDALNDQYKWSAKFITDLDLPGDFAVQASFNAVGPKISGTKEENTIWFTDFGVEKRILKNGSLTFRMTDVFSSLKKEKMERTEKSVTYETEYTEGRIFLAGLSWKF